MLSDTCAHKTECQAGHLDVKLQNIIQGAGVCQQVHAAWHMPGATLHEDPLPDIHASSSQA